MYTFKRNVPSHKGACFSFVIVYTHNTLKFRFFLNPCINALFFLVHLISLMWHKAEFLNEQYAMGTRNAAE